MSLRSERGDGRTVRSSVERRRVVMWSHLPPAGGGLTVVARSLAADPDLRQRFEMEFRGTAEASPDAVTRPTPGNVGRALRDALSMFRQVRGAAVVEVFSAGHTVTVLLRALLLTLSARIAGARVLLYLGNGRFYPRDPSSFRPDRGMPSLFKLLGRLTSAFVIIDDNARPVIGAMAPAARIELIPAPIDPSRFGGGDRPPRARPVLLHAGRITREKGVPDLLEACRLLDEDGVGDWELRLVGPLERSTGDELADIEASAARLGRVTFVGWVDGIEEELANANLFVSASHREGLSGAIAEAAMSGLPVVATDVGATATIVRDGKDGLLVPARDPRALSEALACLLEDPDRRAEMGRSARDHAIALYSRERIAARYVELIEELL